MFKKLVIGAGLALCVAACATAPSAASKPTAAAAVRPPTGCVGSTATRLPVNPGECAGFGSTYTQQDIQRTGVTETQDALRMLDPSVVVHGL